MRTVFGNKKIISLLLGYYTCCWLIIHLKHDIDFSRFVMLSDSFWDRGGNVKRAWIKHIPAFETYVNTIDFLFEVAIVYMLPYLRACSLSKSVLSKNQHGKNSIVSAWRNSTGEIGHASFKRYFLIWGLMIL